MSLAVHNVVQLSDTHRRQPRLVTVLGRFSQHPDLSSLRQDLELLIDEYTPFFKANVEALPPVERKGLRHLGRPALHHTVSALLGRLMRRGAVQIVENEPGRRRYELTERLYNLYHLLRRPGGDRRVRALVDILVHLYEPTERLELQLAAATGQPLPRELRELQELLEERRNDRL